MMDQSKQEQDNENKGGISNKTQEQDNKRASNGKLEIRTRDNIKDGIIK
jgi:hypothetical protein